MVASCTKTFQNYGPLGLSLILKDAGALTATVCLAAEAFQLSACPIGFPTLWPAENFFDRPAQQVRVVGGIALGGRKSKK